MKSLCDAANPWFCLGMVKKPVLRLVEITVQLRFENPHRRHKPKSQWRLH
jgi:hypothetical protein